jgi:hypothetical protein
MEQMTSSEHGWVSGSAARLRARFDAVTSPEQRRWLDDTLDEVRAGSAALAARFPAAGRKAGRAPLDPAAGRDDPHAWTADDAARVLLLHAAGEAGIAALETLYQQGDTAERRAVLRALDLIDPGAVGVALVLDAVRTNDGRLLAAALGPYAARHLDQQSWAQAVLKCVFVGVPLAGVAGLDERADAQLARMLADYAHERVAAGRDVPADIWPILRRHDPPELAKLEGELEAPEHGRRAAARRALDAMAAAPDA